MQPGGGDTTPSGCRVYPMLCVVQSEATARSILWDEIPDSLIRDASVAMHYGSTFVIRDVYDI